MKNREKLLDLLLNENEEALANWINSQPLLDQPDIIRELKEIIAEFEEESGIVEAGLTDHLTKFADNYEDAILSEKLDEQMLHIAIDERDKVMDEMENAIIGIREYVIECIVTNASNAKEMKELADKIMELEKNNGTFNPENWKDIL